MQNPPSNNNSFSFSQPGQPINQVQSLSERKTGKLKFFEETKDFGFIVVDEDQSDLFVHYDDLKKAKVNKEVLVQAKYSYTFYFSFLIMSYWGKSGLSKKAVELQLIKIEPPSSPAELPGPTNNS